MKKIISVFVVALSLVAYSFALDFSIGGKAILGTNFAADEDLKDSLTGKFANKDTTYDFGGGVYANFALLGSLGVQAEVNVINSSIKFHELNTPETSEYSSLNLDIPVMVWLNLDLWKLTFGFGAGVNFNSEIAEFSAAKNLTKDSFTMGFAAGADVKFFITNNLGIVASARFVCEFEKKEVPVTIDGFGDTGLNYPTVEFPRRTLYGGLGVEWKFF